MKQNRFTTIRLALLGVTALSAVGCIRAGEPAKASLPSGHGGAPTAAAQPPIVAVPAVSSRDLASRHWTEIKDCAYDQRAAFFAGLEQLEAAVDAQVAELTAKRATMKGTTDTTAWDFAMQEMENARSYLKSMGEEAGKASAQAWPQEKAKVGEAWMRTQNACDKVRSSTTI